MASVQNMEAATYAIRSNAIHYKPKPQPKVWFPQVTKDRFHLQMLPGEAEGTQKSRMMVFLPSEGFQMNYKARDGVNPAHPMFHSLWRWRGLGSKALASSKARQDTLYSLHFLF